MRRAKTQAFDLPKALRDAWEMIWKEKLVQRAKDEEEAKERGRAGYRDDRTYYTTASDLENQVRQFAHEEARGEKRGSRGIAWGKPSEWPPVKVYTRSGSLFNSCRDWLLDEVRARRIDSHNFGRHHISGMRFRPHGAPLSEAEKGTMAKHEDRRKNPRPKPKHFAKNYGNALCVKKPSWRGSRVWTTKEEAEVTCARCKNLLAAEKAKPTCTAA